MALLAPERLLPRPPTADERLLDRARRPGRVRDVAVRTWRAMREAPLRADPIVRAALREARQLHSNERRLVADGLYGLVRHHRYLAWALGTDDAEALWDGWLSPPDRLPDLGGGNEADVEVLAILGSIDGGFAERLMASVADPIGFLAASNQRAPLVLRANRLRCDRDRLAARLATEGLPTAPCARAPDGLVAAKAVDVHTLGAWRDGWCEVQDEGSQLVGELVRGGRVVDFCAGAGGKALQLAAHGADVLALDVRSRALEELADRARRAGARIRTARIDRDGRPPADARQWGPDAVLVDAPCSGSGTLRRHPELRWRIDARHVAEMAALQRSVLAEAATLVGDGGRLVYSTCSVLRDEDEDVVAGFLADHPAFRRDGDVLRLSPDIDGTDGFFAVTLVRG